MYVPPNKNLPGLKARTRMARERHEAAAKVEQQKINAEKINRVAGK